MTIPQAKKTVPRAHESSSMRSPRDSDSISKHWLRHNSNASQENVNSNSISALNRKVEAMRRRILGGSGPTQQANTLFFRGEYSVSASSGFYKINDMVRVPTGINAGTYILVEEYLSGDHPWLGSKWVVLASDNLGQWM